MLHCILIILQTVNSVNNKKSACIQYIHQRLLLTDLSLDYLDIKVFFFILRIYSSDCRTVD